MSKKYIITNKAGVVLRQGQKVIHDKEPDLKGRPNASIQEVDGKQEKAILEAVEARSPQIKLVNGKVTSQSWLERAKKMPFRRALLMALNRLERDEKKAVVEKIGAAYALNDVKAMLDSFVDMEVENTEVKDGIQAILTQEIVRRDLGPS